jgi:hypothetical protein
MAAPLEDYKALIDALVRRRPSVLARWVTEGRGWPDLPENRAINEFLGSLTSSQKAIVAQLLQEARDSGMHDVLAYLNDEINLAGLRLVRNGQELPVEPYGTEMYYDWVSRREGDTWPDEKANR